MKKDKLKKYSIRFGITFLIVIAFLTYFSGTIDNMLLPQVKVSDVAYGTINGEQSRDDRYLIPLSAVIAMEIPALCLLQKQTKITRQP